MANEPDNKNLEIEIRDLRTAVDDALVSVAEQRDVDLSQIGDMVESLKNCLQQEMMSMEPAERDALLIELTQIVAGFGTLEEAIKAHAAFPAGLEDEVEN